VVTGAQSHLAVIDVDPRHGGDDTLAELQRTYQDLPVTPMVLTGGGGQHYYFATDGALPACQLGPGIDFQAEGRMVVAPPSLHFSGRQYAWELSADIEEVPLAPLPAWVGALAQDHACALQASAALPDRLPDVTLQDLKVSARIKFLIFTGVDCHQVGRYPSRSEALFAAIVAMASAGHDDATIASVVMNPAYGISGKVLSQKNANSPHYQASTRAWVVKEIARARQRSTSSMASKPSRWIDALRGGTYA
jgi:hypothetical protein